MRSGSARSRWLRTPEPGLLGGPWEKVHNREVVTVQFASGCKAGAAAPATLAKLRMAMKAARHAQ